MTHSRGWSAWGTVWLVAALMLASPGRSSAVDNDIALLEEKTFKEAAALAAPAIVRIQTVGGLDQVAGILTTTGPTTGVAVSADGYIISSAFNFISKPASILVELSDGRRFPADAVATDRVKMITLLKVDVNNLVPMAPAPKDSIRVGQWALALGRTYDSPLPSISIGIVSARDRIWGGALQTDAKVSPVNYGGPLVDVAGRVMGILVPLSSDENDETAGVEWYDSGIGFAIPAQDVLGVLERLKKGADLYPGLMGIEFSRSDPLVAKVKIEHVRTLSPAEKAGLKPGDLIVELDGRKVARWADVKYALGNRYAGDEIQVVVKRGEETVSAKLVLAKELPPYESGFLGILPTRDPLTGEIPAGAGIRYVYPDSPAAKAGLMTRDRITGFNGQSVANSVELARLVSFLRPAEKANVRYMRDGKEGAVDLVLAAVPDKIPQELSSQAIPEPPAAPVADAAAAGAPQSEKAGERGSSAPRKGRFSVQMESHGHGYWAYVPESYNPDFAYGLMVWVHPNGDTMEADVFNRWKAICDRRGLILLGPKSAEPSWTPSEGEFVKDAVAEIRRQYKIDGSRVFLHSFGNGGALAYAAAFKYRDVFRGIAPVAQPITMRPPENKPDAHLQFHLVCGSEDPVYRGVSATALLLERMKFPVSLTSIDGMGHAYPTAETLEEIGRWADCLDRI